MKLKTLLKNFKFGHFKLISNFKFQISNSGVIHRFRRSRKLQIGLIVIVLFTPMAIFLLRNPAKAVASWFDDNFFYRQLFTFGNTGAAVSNQKVKIDLNTAALVESNTTNFNTTDSTFTPAMAKRNAPGPFTAAPIVQSKDILSASQGTQINGNFYANFDTTQGSVALWYTPEYATGTDKKYIWYINANYYLAYDYANTRYEQKIGSQTQTITSTLVAGTTYGLITRWDTQNVIQGTNYADLSINDSQNFGITTQPTVSAPASTIYIGTDGTTASDGIIEGLTVYRRVLYDGTNGINAGNGDEVATIKLSGGTDPTLTTGSWDVVFALPTNSTVGALATGTGEAWSHPHSSNLLYTSTTNTGGFMMNGTYTSDGWAAIGSPTIAALATGSKIFAGGYSAASSGAANEGISYTKALTASANYVIRALGNSDGTCNPQVLVTRADGTTEITHLNGTTTSTRTAPDTYIFTFQAPATENGIFKLINTASTGTCSWHQVEVQSNLLPNSSFDAGWSGADPNIPTNWTNSGFTSGEGAQETTIVHSGGASFKKNNSALTDYIRKNISVSGFLMTGNWLYVTSGSQGYTYGPYTPLQYNLNANGGGWDEVSTNVAAWTPLYAVYRDNDQNGGNQSFVTPFSNAGGNSTAYTDDVYAFTLTDVSLTVTPATLANSTETSGLRVDGRDTLTQTISNLTTTAGTIKFKYTPRHSAADALKFVESSVPLVATFISDANNWITVAWSAANTIRLEYTMNGTTANTTWAATGAIVAGTTYAMQIDYTGGGNMTLAVDGVTKITLSSIPAAFGTTPTTAYWGSTSTGDRQTDATFAAGTVTTGVKMQTDCDDIRFTDINGQVLDYYFDSTNGPCNTLTSDFYVLMPTINTGNNIIHIYYGNPSASSGSRSSQFSEATFSPTSGPTASSEEKGGAPVAYWKFDDATGTNAQDSSPNNNDGTITGASWQTEDMCVSGKCLKYNGSSDFVNINNSTTFDGTSSTITVSGWVKHIPSNDGIMVAKGGASSGGWNVNTSSDGKVYVAFKNGAGNSVIARNSSSTLNSNQWNFVSIGITVDTATLGNNNIQIYINGSLNQGSLTQTSLPTVSTAKLKIGARGADGAESTFYQGFIDDVKIYNYARTAAQVKTDYASRGSSKGTSVIASGAKQSSAAISSGLVGYWKMDEAAANGCTGGVNDSCDSSGNANNGAWQDNVTSSTGKFGNATLFDGTNDYINVPTSTAINHTTNGTFSIGIWVKPDTLTSVWRRGIIVQESYLNSGYRLGFDDGGAPRFWTNQSGGTLTMLSSTAMTINQWNHVLVTYNNQQAYLYLNGIQVGNSTGTYIAGTNDFGIGAAVSEDYSGSLDDVRIYNRALSPREVRDLYNWAPGPIAYWNFEEKTGTVASDTSGNGRTGTLTLGPTWTTGKYGSGLSFDGSDDNVSIASSTAFDLGGKDFTIESWFKINPSSTDGTRLGFVTRTQESGNPADILGYLIGRDTSNNIVFGTGDGAGTYNWTTSNNNTYSKSDNSWHHVSAVYSSGTKYLYIDGIKQTDTDTVTVASYTGANLLIGRFWSSGTNNTMHGNLDDVKLYSYARTPAQIQEDLQAGRQKQTVGYWKFDEGQGITANNSGNGGSVLNGTLTSMASPATATSGWTNSGKFNKALVFDGSNDYVDFGDQSAFDFAASDSFTVSFWFKTSTSSPANSAVMFSKYKAGGTTQSFYFQLSNSTNIPLFAIYDGTNNPSASGVLAANDNSWHNIIGVRNVALDKLYLFVDGKQVGSATDTTTGSLANAHKAHIGCLLDGFGTACNANSGFTGLIDEVKIYNYALTSDEVKLDYNRGSATVVGTISSIYCVPGSADTCTAPVGEWNFEEGSGASAQDSSGNGNTGTWAGTGTHYSPGKFGKGGKFNGSSDYIGMSSGTNYANTQDHTYEAWVKYTSYPGASGYEWILDNGGSLTGTSLILRSPSAGTAAKIAFFYGGGSAVTVANTSLSLNAWYHVSAVYSATTNKVTFYLNGVDDGTSGTLNTWSGGTSVNNVGRWNQSGGMHYFTGSIDQVRIFNYARTPAQVAWDYNQGKPVGWWKFNECQGAVANDSSGNLNSGTITIGASGTQTSVGNCSTSATTAWYSGRTGKYNSSLNFDGTDDYVNISSTTGLIGNSKRSSIAAWIKTTSTDAFVYGEGRTTASDPNYVLGISSGKLYTYARDNAGTINSVSGVGPAINNGAWTHIAVTIDENGKLTGAYVNGVNIGSATTNTLSTLTTNNANIGVLIYAAYPGGLSYFSGQIDDVQIFNYALTATQIKNLFNQNSAVRFGPQTGAP